MYWKTRVNTEELMCNILYNRGTDTDVLRIIILLIIIFINKIYEKINLILNIRLVQHG